MDVLPDLSSTSWSKPVEATTNGDSITFTPTGTWRNAIVQVTLDPSKNYKFTVENPNGGTIFYKEGSMNSNAIKVVTSANGEITFKPNHPTVFIYLSNGPITNRSFTFTNPTLTEAGSEPPEIDLLPNLNSGLWTKHPNATVIGTDSLSLNASASWQNTEYTIPSEPNTEYQLKLDNPNGGTLLVQSMDSVNKPAILIESTALSINQKIKTPANSVKIRYVLTSGYWKPATSGGKKTFVFNNPSISKITSGTPPTTAPPPPTSVPPNTAVLQKLRNKVPVKIIAIGDSNTKGFEWNATLNQEVRAKEHYPKVLERYLEEKYGYTGCTAYTVDGSNPSCVTVINAGVSGNTTVDGLARYDRDVTNKNPDMVIIMFGSNDMSQGMSVQTYKVNLKRMIDKSQAAGDEVILMTGRTVVDGQTGQPIPGQFPYHDAVRALAKEENVPLVDVAQIPYEGNYPGTWDGVHFAPEKYHLIADRIMHDYFDQSWPTDLMVHKSGRFLQHTDGTPFFQVGDTAWNILAKLTDANIIKYLDDRKAKGFNVIQFPVTFENSNKPNREGQYVTTNINPANPTQIPNAFNPNPNYFAQIDFVIKEAGKRGMYVALLPTWGANEVEDRSRKGWGMFNPYTLGRNEANSRAFSFGQFLGGRYTTYNNLIWWLGGDTHNDGTMQSSGITGRDYTSVYENFANGIKSKDTRHLMSFHPGWLGTYKYYHNKPWLDFNLMQSSHYIDRDNYRDITEGYVKTPRKPIIDAEPRYEDHPHAFIASNPKISAFDVRQAQYWAVFSGAAGISYGQHFIWQMNSLWETGLNAIGSSQMVHVKNLLLSRPYFNRIPDQSLITSAQPIDGDNNNLAGAEGNGAYIVATREENGTGKGSYAFIYTPFGDTFTVNLSKVTGTVKATWFNPKNGTTQPATHSNGTFNPPNNRTRGNDWVLILDDASKNYPMP